MLHGENIICFSSKHWDSLWTRKQKFMDILSKYDNNVLYVEPIFGITRTIGYPEKAKNTILRTRLTQIRKNLHVLTPRLLFPGQSYLELFNRLNQYILKREVQKYQEKLGLYKPILWVYNVKSVEMIGSFSEQFIIYGCTDRHWAFPGPGINKSLIKKLEEKLLRKSDVVFVTARGLLAEKRDLNKNTFFIPNGVDVGLFSRAQDCDCVVPPDTRNLSRPILGFIGGIASWVDLDLINYIARKKPQWSIVLIGPVSRSVRISRFKRISNVYFLGSKDQNILPSYLKGFNVCLNPFKVNELTKTVNPLKIYDYLAAGKPVVSVDMPEVKSLSEVVYIAKSYDDFIAGIMIELDREKNREKIIRRMKVAERYSWEDLLDLECCKIKEIRDIKRLRTV